MAIMSDSSQPLDNKGRKKVQCMLCAQDGVDFYQHRLTSHVSKQHLKSASEYKSLFPFADLFSESAKELDSKREIESKILEEEDKNEEIAKDENKEKEIKKKVRESISDSDEFKIGCARLSKRIDLSEEHKILVPVFDENWEVGSTEHDHLENLALGIETREPVFIVGNTGCGKSLLVKQLAATCNQPMMRMNLHGDVRAADFVGDKTVSVDPETGQSIITYKYGVLPQAMKIGAWLLLDELDAAQAHILFVLQAVMENDMTLVLSSNYGEIIKADPNFAIIATANTLGKGDDTGLYTGTNQLNEAFLDRFGTVIKMDYPKQDSEVNILMSKTGLNRNDCIAMVEIANQVRTAQARDSVYCTFGTRKLLHWAKKAVRFGDIHKAAQVAVLNRLSFEDAKVVGGLIQKKFGSKKTFGEKTDFPDLAVTATIATEVIKTKSFPFRGMMPGSSKSF